jgi:hypothetical protein
MDASKLGTIMTIAEAAIAAREVLHLVSKAMTSNDKKTEKQLRLNSFNGNISESGSKISPRVAITMRACVRHVYHVKRRNSKDLGTKRMGSTLTSGWQSWT